MKSKLTTTFFAFFFCLANCIFAQNGFTNVKEAKNKIVGSLKEGKWIEYLDENSMPVGKDSAMYYSLAIYKKGEKEGIVRYYSMSGGLETETIFKDGERNGISRAYFSESRKLKSEVPYLNDEINGVVKNFYENGNLKATAYYENGLISDTAFDYYEDGMIKSKIPYINNQKNGLAVAYYQNGNISTKTHYVNGKMEDLPIITKMGSCK